MFYLLKKNVVQVSGVAIGPLVYNLSQLRKYSTFFFHCHGVFDVNLLNIYNIDLLSVYLILLIFTIR